MHDLGVDRKFLHITAPWKGPRDISQNGDLAHRLDVFAERLVVSGMETKRSAAPERAGAPVPCRRSVLQLTGAQAPRRSSLAPSALLTRRRVFVCVQRQ